jgi:pimeloyl-ACP methyl ester carboxylesterase
MDTKNGLSLQHLASSLETEPTYYIRRTRGVVSLDLRGHGEIDAAAEGYTMAGYAGDIAWLCAALDLQKPLMVGHSMGGTILLELAARYPKIPGSIVLIDSVRLPSDALIEGSAPFIAALSAPEFAAAYRNGISRLHLGTDEIAAHDSVFALLP